jgi:NADH-quinone oxidoreductase subunit A
MHPDTALHPYVPLLIYAVIALAVPVILSLLAAKLGRQVPEPYKYDAYESGYATTPWQGRIPIKYYLVAMLFVVFDVEAASFYPWAVNLRLLGAYGLWTMAVFIAVLGIGYAYAWKKEGFTWK